MRVLPLLAASFFWILVFPPVRASNHEVNRPQLEEVALFGDSAKYFQFIPSVVADSARFIQNTDSEVCNLWKEYISALESLHEAVLLSEKWYERIEGLIVTAVDACKKGDPPNGFLLDFISSTADSAVIPMEKRVTPAPCSCEQREVPSGGGASVPVRRWSDLSAHEKAVKRAEREFRKRIPGNQVERRRRDLGRAVVKALERKVKQATAIENAESEETKKEKSEKIYKASLEKSATKQVNGDLREELAKIFAAMEKPETQPKSEEVHTDKKDNTNKKLPVQEKDGYEELSR